MSRQISKLILEHPIELAYCLALINTNSLYSITPPWVIKNYPAVERIMFLLRSNPCLRGCAYCNEALDIHKGLKTSLDLMLIEPMQVNLYRRKLSTPPLLINHSCRCFLRAVGSQLLFKCRL